MRRKKISESTIKSPNDKAKEIQSLIDELKKTDELKALSSLGLEVKQSMSSIQAKAIPVPRLKLGKNNTVESGRESSFSLFNKPIFSAKHKVVCGIIMFKGTDLTQLLQTFTSTSKNLEINIKFDTYELQGRSVKDIERKI